MAEGQGGYFTAAQAAAVGYRYPQQVYQRRIGAWEPIDHGLFRLRDFPPGEYEDLIRWSLWSRDRHGAIQATVSHNTAADLYGFGDLMPARIHLTVPPGFRKPTPDSCVLHVARLPPGDVAAHGGYRVTTPTRTVLDLAASPLAEDQFAKVLRDALRSGLVRRKHLVDAGMTDEARRAPRAGAGDDRRGGGGAMPEPRRYATATAFRTRAGGAAAPASGRQPIESRSSAAAGGVRAPAGAPLPAG